MKVNKLNGNFKVFNTGGLKAGIRLARDKTQMTMIMG